MEPGEVSKTGTGKVALLEPDEITELEPGPGEGPVEGPGEGPGEVSELEPSELTRFR